MPNVTGVANMEHYTPLNNCQAMLKGIPGDMIPF